MAIYPKRLNGSIFKHGRSFQTEKRVLHEFYPTHWHEFYETDIILGGKCEFVVNGVRYEQQADMASLVSPVDFHSVKPLGNEAVEYYNLMFYEECISDRLMTLIHKNRMPVMVRLDRDAAARVRTVCEILETEEKRESSWGNYYAAHLMECILIDLLRCGNRIPGEHLDDLSSVRYALSYIQENFLHRITLSDISAQSGFSAGYMSKKFKAFTGMGFHEYLSEIRCKHARNLLLSTDSSAYDICFESGFNSFSQFARSFKKCYGSAPGVYRKNALHAAHTSC